MKNSFSKHAALPSARTVLCGLVVLLASCQTKDQNITEQDSDAIRSVMEKYVSTALAGDWDAWGTTITADGVFSPPNQETLEGREAIVAWGKTFPKLTSFNATPIEVVGRIDLAYAYGPYSFTATLPNGASITDQGTYVNVFQKQPDGSWLYSRAIWHSNLPVPTVLP